MPRKSAQPEKNFSELRNELDAILSELQQTELDIDTAVEKYERGLVLVKELETYLKTAENKITKIKSELAS